MFITVNSLSSHWLSEASFFMGRWRAAHLQCCNLELHLSSAPETSNCNLFTAVCIEKSRSELSDKTAGEIDMTSA